MSQRNRLDYPDHLEWVRTHRCLVDGCGERNTVAHHVRHGFPSSVPSWQRGGTGRKPHDKFTVPLCDAHHKELHNRGAKTFERDHGHIDLMSLALNYFAANSPHREQWGHQ